MKHRNVLWALVLVLAMVFAIGTLAGGAEEFHTLRPI